MSLDKCKWQPTPVFLPGESQGRGSRVGCRLWGRTELDTTEATEQQQQEQAQSTIEPDLTLIFSFPIPTILNQLLEWRDNKNGSSQERLIYTI